MASLTELEARLTARKASLVIALATYDELLAKQAKQYSLNTSEGIQSATRQSLSEIKKQINELEADIEALETRIYGGNIVRFSSSRWK